MKLVSLLVAGSLAVVAITAARADDAEYSSSAAAVLATQEVRGFGTAQQIAQNCCPCPPTASDQQCFVECNSMLPRCVASAPQPRAKPQPKQCPATFSASGCLFNSPIITPMAVRCFKEKFPGCPLP